MEKRTVNTELVGREETFKLMAVAEATGFPLLLEGPPGTGKTRLVLDYGKGYFSGDYERTVNGTFILETDEGTRSAEIKGRIDLKTVIEKNAYAISAPIASKEFVLINEVDKASAALRNSMLGVMNEGFVFNGEEKIACQWRVFVATCNAIPSEEKNSPFWDRFVLKSKLTRITKQQMLGYYKGQEKGKAVSTIELNIPSEEDMKGMKLDHKKLSKFVSVCYDSLSDRSLACVPRLVKAVGVVYGLNQARAMVMAATLLAGEEAGIKLSGEIESKVVTTIRSSIEMLQGMRNYDQIKDQILIINNHIQAALQSGDVEEGDLQELTREIHAAVDGNPAYAQGAKAVQDEEESFTVTATKVNGKITLNA